jgi:hypothetical protein
MRVEKFLWSIAVICAVLLLTAPLSGRTRWTKYGVTRITDSAGWDWVAPVSGLAAIAGLVAGVLSRPNRIVSALAATTAAITTGVAAFATGSYWIDLMQGAADVGGYELHAPPALPYYAAIAAVAMCLALALAGLWLLRSDDDW